MDASTPRTGLNHWPRLRHLGQYCTRIPEIPSFRSPTRSTQPEHHCADSSPALPVAGPLAILAQLQRDVHILKMASPIRSSPEPGPKPVPHQSVRITNTAVPRFNGDACWYQHQQVFEAVVKSNGWDDKTAALQPFAHLEGYALNMAPLVPEATWSGLSGALSDHYSYPERLAVYRREYETTVRRDGEDPSIFATELETLAARGFGDAGPSTRIWFVTRH